MIVEAELCAAVSEILQELGFDNFIIRINHRDVLRGILNAAKIEKEKQSDALIALDKLDKIGKDGVLKEFVQREIDENAGVKILDLFDALATAGNTNTLARLAEFTGEQEADGLNNLSQIIGFTNLENVKIDASLARGLSYYTGAIFEINVPDLAGSLGGGGRYDGLIGMFGKEQIPACGFSLGLERILVVMEERGMFPPELTNSSADVLVTVWNEDAVGESLKLAGELRRENLCVLVYPEADKLGKQFKYADSLGVKTAIILREEEIAENKVKVKNLQTGEEKTFSRDELTADIASGKF
jgi:histidyl-tRNA synthetase